MCKHVHPIQLMTNVASCDLKIRCDTYICTWDGVGSWTPYPLFACNQLVKTKWLQNT